MASITVKNIPADLYEHLKESAGANHRSLNGEIIACLELRGGDSQDRCRGIPARAQQLQKKWRGPPMTDAEFTAAKCAGRP